MTTVPQIVDVYFVTPKKNINQAPKDHLNLCLLEEGDGLRAATNATAIATGNATSGAAAADNWGQSPFALKTFRNSWKCLKKITLTLHPGDQKHVKLNLIFNKYIDQLKYTNTENSNAFIANLTVVPLVVTKAGLVGVATEAGADTSEVAYGSAKVGVSSDMEINCKGVLDKFDMHISRVYKGMIEASTEALKEIDDNDNVVIVERN